MSPEVAALGVAAIGQVGLLGAAWLSQRKTRAKVEESQRATRAKVEEVHQEVRTNHGKQASEYLEMIGELKKGQDALLWLFAEHTQQDAAAFAELKGRFEAIMGRSDPKG